MGLHVGQSCIAEISASLGFEDGEVIDRQTMIVAVWRISCAIDIPLPADPAAE